MKKDPKMFIANIKYWNIVKKLWAKLKIFMNKCEGFFQFYVNFAFFMLVWCLSVLT